MGKIDPQEGAPTADEIERETADADKLQDEETA